MNNDDIIAKVRKKKPLIHHITTFVTINDCANITLAIGARPVMALYAGEVEEIVSLASALVLNIGTLQPPQTEAMILAGIIANTMSIPVIFDPVGCGASAYRSSQASEILRHVKPTIIKGNMSEIKHLHDHKTKMSGIDSQSDTCNAGYIAKQLSLKTDSTVVITGIKDYISDGSKTACINTGSPMLGMITGTGCMLNSVIAAYAAVCPDYFKACAYAASSMGVCAETAQKKLNPTEGSGTFKQRLLDAFCHIQDDWLLMEGLIKYEEI